MCRQCQQISDTINVMGTIRKKVTANSLILIFTAFIWGVAFVAQTEGGNAVGAFSFNCIRSIIGSITLLPVIAVLDHRKPNRTCHSPWRNRTLITGGIACGIILCIASNLQQLGISLGSTAGKAGFLTACYILIVPLLGIFLGRKVSRNICLGVILALVGLYLLCMEGSFSLQLSDILLLLCAFCFAIHIMVIDHFSPLADGVRMSCIQFAVCGVLTAFPMFIIDMNHSVSGIIRWSEAFTTLEAWIPILYAGVFSCGVAYTLQIIGQNVVNPTVASLIMSLESVFAAVAGWFILGQTMDIKQITGCVLIFAAIILAQLNTDNQNL